MPTKYRCSASVFDSETKRFRKCKNKINQLSGSFCLCTIHIKKYIIIIQSAWRSFRMRRKINIFKKLPCDIWNHILFKSRYEHFIHYKLYNSYLKIYNKKLNFLINNLSPREKFAFKIRDFGLFVPDPSDFHICIYLQNRIEELTRIKLLI